MSLLIFATSSVLAAATLLPGPPGRQPQLAAGYEKVAMTFGSGSTIYFSLSTDQGRTFTPPVKVAEMAALALGRHRGPRIAILKDAIVISAVAGETKAQPGSLIAWRTTDDGKTWKRSATINDVPDAAREGLHAMIARPGGSLFAVWLDLRVKGTRLVGSASTDGGVTWSKNTLVYASPGGTICQCCHPSLALDEKGALWVMWRNALDGSRDLYAASSSDGIHFTPARKLGAGTWKLDACPMDGGGLTVSNNQVTSAWRREGQIYLSRSETSEVLVGDGKDVAIAGGYLAWTKDGGIQLLAPGKTAPVTVADEGGFPALLKLGGGTVLLAWETKASIETRVFKQ
jgi:hypothetical protein